MTSKVSPHIVISWGADHRTGDGRLIARVAKVEPPGAIDCVSVKCLWRYTRQAFLYVLVKAYHSQRVAYAEEYRDEIIPGRYRTGERSPTTIRGAILAILELRLRRLLRR